MTSFYDKRMAYLAERFGISLEDGLQVEGLRPKKETTLEEVSETFKQSQEKGYSESLAAQTKYKGKKFGLAIVLR
jgi:hypothetical protein